MDILFILAVGPIPWILVISLWALVAWKGVEYPIRPRHVFALCGLVLLAILVATGVLALLFGAEAPQFVINCGVGFFLMGSPAIVLVAAPFQLWWAFRLLQRLKRKAAELAATEATGPRGHDEPAGPGVKGEQ